LVVQLESEVTMPAQFPFLHLSNFHAADGALRVTLHTLNNPEHRRAAEKRARAFITISRQPGSGGVPLAQRLAERLNTPAPGDWTAWDQELVEKISAEYHLDKRAVETINQRPHNWLDDLVSSVAQQPGPSDIRVYKDVARTIRALALGGHAIIVGRGAQFITSGMPGGIHLRLIAPLEFRIKTTMEAFGMSHGEAAKQLADIERNRESFYRRFWPGKTLEAQSFSMTLNSAQLSLEEMVQSVLPIIHLRDSAGEAAAVLARH
jgi:cytidylate kinase